MGLFIRLLFMLFSFIHPHQVTNVQTVCDYYEHGTVTVCGPDNGFGHVNVSTVYVN